MNDKIKNKYDEIFDNNEIKAKAFDLIAKRILLWKFWKKAKN